jgi:hypothetical protein
MEEGARSEDDQDRCLYVGTPWEAEVVIDRRDLDEFKEAARTIDRVLLVRAIVELLRFLLQVFECREVQWPFCLFSSLLLNGRKLGQVCCGRWRTRTQRPPQPMR